MNKILLEEIKETLIKEYASKYGSDVIKKIDKIMKLIKSRLKLMKQIKKDIPTEELLICQLVIMVIDIIRLLEDYGFEKIISTKELFNKLSISNLLRKDICRDIQHMIDEFDILEYNISEMKSKYTSSISIIPSINIVENISYLIDKLDELLDNNYKNKKEICEIILQINDGKIMLEHLDVFNIDDAINLSYFNPNKQFICDIPNTLFDIKFEKSLIYLIKDMINKDLDIVKEILDNENE